MRTFAVLGWCLALLLGFGLLVEWRSAHQKQPDLTHLVQALRQDSATTHQQLAVLQQQGARLDTLQDTVRSVVTRWRTTANTVDTLHDTVATQLVRAGDQLAGRCTQLQDQCQLFHDSATTLIQHLQRQYSRLDSLYQARPAAPRWGVSVVFGAGVGAQAMPSVHPVLAFGLSYRLF